MTDPTPDEALARWLDALAGCGAAAPTASEVVGLDDALGRVLGADVAARQDVPAARCAAMDGFAVASARAPAGELGPGAHLRVDTGQPLPDWADAVVRLEDARLRGDVLAAGVDVTPGLNVREAGEDIRRDTVVLRAGSRLDPYSLAVAAASGHTTLEVRARPLVAVLPTGDEVRAPGAIVGAGEVADANGPMLAALARDAGAQATRLPVCRDDPDALADAVAAACAGADVLLVVAGSSRGRRDHARTALDQVGRVIVHGVALRPARPVMLAVAGRCAVIGVPGYPVSAAVAFERFVRPLLDRLLGRAGAPLPSVPARLSGELRARPGPTVSVPVTVAPEADGLAAAPHSRRASALVALAASNGFVHTSEGGRVAAGARVDVVLHPWAPR
jgi:putative molybdopterin biosynthesis protein